MTSTLDLHRAWVALQAAELDGDPDRSALILHRDDDPDFGAKVAVHGARQLVALASRDGEETRALFGELVAEEMLRLAQADRLI